MPPQAPTSDLERVLTTLLDQKEQDWQEDRRKQMVSDVVNRQGTADLNLLHQRIDEALSHRQPDDQIPSSEQQDAIIKTLRQQVDTTITRIAAARWPQTTNQGHPTSDAGKIWLPLAQLHPEPHAAPPSAIRIDQTELNINGSRGKPTWAGLTCTIAKWLYEQCLMTKQMVPITIINERRPAIKSRKDSKYPSVTIAEGIHLETSASNQQQTERARALLQKFQVDLSRCHVLADPSVQDAESDRSPQLPQSLP